jgi:hypothetical protein
MSSLGLLMLLTVQSAQAGDRPCVVVVVGAPGTAEYASEFRGWADLWKAAAIKGGAESILIGTSDEPEGSSDRERLHTVLTERSSPAKEPLWVVLLGHGTFDGREAKFNLRGPDVSDQELAKWLEPVKRRVVLIDGSSASAPFLGRLSGPNRIIITATRSGSEVNYARFGHYLSEAIADPRADLDKDGQVSLLEAYLSASHRVADYYRTRSQLATEHALLDDNGDKLGTPPDWFRGVRATRRAKDGAPPDGLRAHQVHLIPSDRERRIPAEVRRRRDELELAVAALRDQKSKVGEDEYYRRLEPIMVELGRLYRQAGDLPPVRTPSPAPP